MTRTRKPATSSSNGAPSRDSRRGVRVPIGRTGLLLVLTLGVTSGESTAQTAREECARPPVQKVEGQAVWEPGPAGQQIPLWPDSLRIATPETGGRPEWVGNGSPMVAGRLWNWATFVSRPTMTIYKPKGVNTGAAMLVLPGGGYAAVAMDLEGTEVCDWMTAHGVTCVVLKYRVPQTWLRDARGGQRPPDVQLPLQDVQRAMGLLRQRATEYGIDPRKLGVIGFSAGGHLAAAVSNAERRTYAGVDAADQLSSVPSYAVLLYPGRIWNSRSTQPGLRTTPWMRVSRNAPPTLLIHAMNDPVDDVRESMAYGLALNDVGVPTDLRLYAKGCHAFGLRPTADPITTEWPDLVVGWLRNLNVLSKSPTR